MNSQNQQNPPNDPFAAQNDRAEALIGQGDHPLAAELLIDIVQKDPDNCRAFNNLGVLSWAREKWDDSFLMFKKSVLIKPDFADALVNLFDAALKLKKVDEALPLLEAALAADPMLDEIQAIVASINSLGSEIYLSDRALAIGIYSSIIEEADKLLEQGNLTKAMELYLKANDDEGPSAKAFSGMGVISFYQKHYEDAYSLFMESIKLNPSDREAFLNLLDTAKECNKKEHAKQVFNVCKEQFPDLESIAPEFEKLETL